MDNKPTPVPYFMQKEHNNMHNKFENQYNSDDIREAIATMTGSKLDMMIQKNAYIIILMIPF